MHSPKHRWHVFPFCAALLVNRFQGLRGTDNQLARLARRLKVTYRVDRPGPDKPDYAVSHGKSVYIFDATGAARVMWPQFDTTDADIDAATRDLRRLLSG